MWIYHPKGTKKLEKKIREEGSQSTLYVHPNGRICQPKSIQLWKMWHKAISNKIIFAELWQGIVCKVQGTHESSTRRLFSNQSASSHSRKQLVAVSIIKMHCTLLSAAGKMWICMQIQLGGMVHNKDLQRGEKRKYAGFRRRLNTMRWLKKANHFFFLKETNDISCYCLHGCMWPKQLCF